MILLKSFNKMHLVSAGSPAHLVVILHGFMGFGKNVEELAKAVRERFGTQALVVVPKSFPVLASMDGIDVIAERIAEELRATVKAHPSLTSISLVGYSMGGLIARYLAGSLFVEKPCAFLGLKPINLITIACPHVGARQASDRTFATRALLSLASLVGGRSAAQMTCADGDDFLLAHMACRRSAFARGLGAFARRSAYANTQNDRTVPFWTAFISPWRHGTPVAPPVGRGGEARVDATTYPHVDWQGTVGGAGDDSGGGDGGGDAGGDFVAGIYAPSAADARVTATIATPHPADPPLTCPQRGALAGLLSIFLCVLLPLWLSIILPCLLMVRGARGFLLSWLRPSRLQMPHELRALRRDARSDGAKVDETQREFGNNGMQHEALSEEESSCIAAGGASASEDSTAPLMPSAKGSAKGGSHGGTDGGHDGGSSTISVARFQSAAATAPVASAAAAAMGNGNAEPKDGGYHNREAEGEDGGSYWSRAVLRSSLAASRADNAQEWMSSELNSLQWHKVSVRFHLALDGLQAMHTHGHIVVRNLRVDRVGIDVVRHIVDHMASHHVGARGASPGILKNCAPAEANEPAKI